MLIDQPIPHKIETSETLNNLHVQINVGYIKVSVIVYGVFTVARESYHALASNSTTYQLEPVR